MTALEVVAQRIWGQSSSVFLFSTSINSALKLLEIPDPEHPFPDNRRVSKKHAMDFGNYWESHFANWLVPPILVDSSTALDFKSMLKTGSETEIVQLELSLSDSRLLRILDGQHRILGWYLKRIQLDSRLIDLTSEYNKATIEGHEEKMFRVQNEIALTKSILSRFEREHVVFNLIDSVDIEKHKQYFVDIAKNALGINKTVQAKFDSSSVINRVTKNVVSRHPLFIGRIDLEKTTCSGTNSNLLSVVNVADITRHSCFGVNTRVTERRENTYEDRELEMNISSFLDAMLNNIPQLRLIVDGRMSPVEFRERSMLGSGTIWRCLAGTFYETCVTNDDNLGIIRRDPIRVRKFEQFLQAMSSNSGLPISRQWFGTTLFPSRTSKAPSSRSQDLHAMVRLMTAFVENGQLFVPKNPGGLK